MIAFCGRAGGPRTKSQLCLLTHSDEKLDRVASPSLLSSRDRLGVWRGLFGGGGGGEGGGDGGRKGEARHKQKAVEVHEHQQCPGLQHLPALPASPVSALKAYTRKFSSSWLCFRSGVQRTQKLRSPLLRTQSYQRFFL